MRSKSLQWRGSSIRRLLVVVALLGLASALFSTTIAAEENHPTRNSPGSAAETERTRPHRKLQEDCLAIRQPTPSDEAVPGIFVDTTCSVDGANLVCPAGSTFTYETETVTLDAYIQCPQESVAQSDFVQASQEGRCGCEAMLYDEDCEQLPYMMDCECSACPVDSLVGYSYTCTTDIVGECKGFDCSGTCLTSLDFEDEATPSPTLTPITDAPSTTQQTDDECPLSPIAGYLPLSQVQDQANIERDMQTISEQLFLKTDEGLDAALMIYAEGAYSKPVAKLTLTTPLEQDFPKGTEVIGTSQNGNRVDGKVLEDSFVGDTSITIQYETACAEQKCQVGANPIPVYDGCLTDDGEITIEGLSQAYTYDPLEDNNNARTILSFSTSAETEMYGCTLCPYSMYQRFYEYYGAFDYADQIVSAAYGGGATDFVNFNQDFGLYPFDFRIEIIRKAMVFMVIWMKVDERMESSIADCENGNIFDNDESVVAWDEAFAYYAGILEAADGSGTGELLYAHADRRCQNFKTCGENADSVMGTSSVNISMLRFFEMGQGMLSQGNCAFARMIKASIEKLMIIPLIQGTLRYAWKMDNEDYAEKTEAKGVGYAMSVVPVVHNCDTDAAATIVRNMGPGEETDFVLVKAAFESTYDCLGILSSEVGGLWDAATGSYFPGTEPLNNIPETDAPTDSSLAPSDAPATNRVASPAPSQPPDSGVPSLMPGVSEAPVTNSPTEDVVPTEVPPTQAPKPVPFTFQDLILGPTPAQGEELARPPTPAGLDYVAKNIRRPGLGNRLPN